MFILSTTKGGEIIMPNAPLESYIKRKIKLAIFRYCPWAIVTIPYGIAVSLKGFPDMMVYLPNGIVIFMEVKRPGSKCTEKQKRWMLSLSKRGFYCFIVHSEEEALYYVKCIMEGIPIETSPNFPFPPENNAYDFICKRGLFSQFKAETDKDKNPTEEALRMDKAKIE